jgi:hypothetical protein
VPNPKPGEPVVELDASAYGFGWVHRQTCSATDQVSHGGAIDTYRAELMLRTSSGIGVVVLTNFGHANTEAFADRAIAVLEATGAMKPREPVASNNIPPVMTKFLEVYNEFDEAKLTAILNRPIDPREHDELAGYKALHGTCTAIKDAKMVGGVARFTLTCERGHFELDVNLDGAGKIGGFLGRSLGATPPADVTKFFDTAIALHLNPTWNEASYKRIFPKKQIPEAEARTVAASLRTQYGTCKPAGFMHEAFGWTVDLKCTKGGPVALSIQFDEHGDLDGILWHPPSGAEPQRCPMK